MGLDRPQPEEIPSGEHATPAQPVSSPLQLNSSQSAAWEQQFAAPPAPPTSRPGYPTPLLPLLPEGAHWGFYQRIGRLRERARADAARGTTLTNTAAALTAGGGALGLLSVAFTVPMLFAAAITANSSTMGNGAASSEVGLVFLMATFALVGLATSLGAFAYSIFILTEASQLFVRSYKEASELFNQHGLAVLVAQEDFIKAVQDLLIERAWIKLEGRSAYHSFEEHLDFCACHFPALRKLANGKPELNIWQLRREENLYKNRKLFSQSTWVYWTCGCLVAAGSLQGGVTTLVLLVYLLLGGRYITSRGVMVALCDFLLLDAEVEGA